MCGRARLSSDVSEIKLVFRIPPEQPTPNFAASWNVAPTDPLPVVRYHAKDHQRSLEVMRWGLIPYAGRRTSASASRPSMRPPRRSAPSRRFVKRSGNGAASCHWTIFANGRKPRALRPRTAYPQRRNCRLQIRSWSWGTAAPLLLVKCMESVSGRKALPTSPDGATLQPEPRIARPLTRLSSNSLIWLMRKLSRANARSAPRTAGTSADRGFRVGRHGGVVAARYQDGSVGLSSRIAAIGSSEHRWSVRPYDGPARLSNWRRSVTRW